MKDEILLKQISMLPDALKKEVLDFVGYLLFKYQQKPLEKPKKKPKFGSAKGMYIIADDFDAPLDDFKDYM
jgi:hypothetical protein